MSADNVLLRVEDLKLYYRTGRSVLQAVDGVSFELKRGRTLAVIGESGCGKSSLARAILRLLPRNVHSYTGSIWFNGREMMGLSDDQFRRDVRWVEMAMVPQAAMNSLNPVVRIGQQIAEPLLVHDRHMSRDAAMKKAEEAFRIVGVPLDFLNRYPFELSGGMRQRAMIAMSLVSRPELVILDEPTSALDLLTQANVMNVLKRIKEEFDTTFILITHDIGTASELADDVAVMYAGKMVEMRNAEHFYTDAAHPYSEALMASVPTLREDKELDFIEGQPPSLINPPTGCRFAARCPHRFDKCDQEPGLTPIGERQHVQCWLHEAGEIEHVQ